MSTQPSSSSTERGASNSPLRPISFGDPVIDIERRADGTIYLRPKRPLGDYPVRITDRLHHWATMTPDRVFMAEREGGRGWRKITYAKLLTASRHIASGLIQRGLSAERPVVILSGNSIDHALLAFGAFYAGIPFCPVSPAYSLVSKDYGKLSYLLKLLTPGLVFAEDADKFADALAANVSLGTEIAASYGSVPGRDVTLLADLMANADPQRSRRGARQDRPRHDRKIPADVGFDRQSQGRHQHSAHDLRQPGDAARDACLPQGRAAGHHRLAALESHLWRQPQYRADALQWRLDVSRRRQADAGRHRGDRAQSPGDLADGLFQRAQGLRVVAALFAR
ncbi:hypothetical protein ACVWYH_002862 [Bradyrhizobium sp. GM24.11]